VDGSDRGDNFPDSGGGIGALLCYQFCAANPDGLPHIRSLGRNSFGLEDQFGLGDHDLDDVIMRLQFQPGA